MLKQLNLNTIKHSFFYKCKYESNKIAFMGVASNL
jgi:hypothetical protein